jgi:uncharacterized protein YybS (DUF2232 family)
MRRVLQTVQRDGSKDIASGIAITCILFAISVYLPVIGFFCALFIPLPILFYRSKLGRTSGVIIPIVTIIAMVVVMGKISIDIWFFFELLLFGFVLSELIERNLSIEKTILYACGIVLFTGLVTLIFYSSLSNVGIFNLISKYVSKNLELTMALYEGMEVSEENLYRLSNSLENIQYVLVRILLSLAVASSFFVAWANLLLARPMLKSRGLYYPEFGALNLWKAPECLVWGAIGCGLMLFLSGRTFKILGLNGMIIFMVIYFFQGIAIVAFFFEKKRFSKMVRFFLYSLIVVQQLIFLLVCGLGFFDMWLNFRKLGIQKN